MTIKSIKSDRDYQRALKQIDNLMDAKPNSAAGDELNLLVTLVEKWEATHHPFEDPYPAAALDIEQDKCGSELPKSP